MTAIFLIVFAIIFAATKIWRRRPVRAAIGTAAICCVLATAYTLLIDRDAQAPIFLMFFYALTGLAALLALGLSYVERRLGRYADRDG